MTLPINPMTSELNVSTDIITSITAGSIGLAEILVIMSISALKTVVILYVSVVCSPHGRTQLDVICSQY
jgi:hypothetical protein